MNLQWFSSPEWATVVKALLHTLWQGAIVAVLLGLALRRLESPVARYRGAMAGLMAVVISGIVTWAVLNRPAPALVPAPGVAIPVSDAPVVTSDAPPLVVNFSAPLHSTAAPGWTAWLALVWLAGATVMLVRAGFQVAGAERLRRASQPVADARLAELLAEARRAVGLMRQVRLAVTDRLTSPAVVGVLVPTLILPLSLASTLSLEQIRFILLHELAHIRRGDYFANLFQLFAEALFFFNPAVWWLSHQMRVEREACCDALAIELSGAPADYARTLVHVAENVLNPAPAAAAAFGDERGRSTLADRVQRLLVPGYRPRLRLTWRAMLASLCVGGTLLMISAFGTRVTVAAILSPQQRVERIEKKMTELGQAPDAPIYDQHGETAQKVKVSGTIQTADGSPVPKWVLLNVHSEVPRSSMGTATYAKDGSFSENVAQGMIYLTATVSNYAPCVVGPLNGMVTNSFYYVVMTLERGFDVPVRVTDADSGQPLPEAVISASFWMHNNGVQVQNLKSGADGVVTLTHCANLPVDVTVNVPGHVILKQHFETVHAGEPLELKVPRGEVLSGIVTDKDSGQPVAGAVVRIMYQTGGNDAGNFSWDDTMHVLGASDANGTFTVNQLQGGMRYYLGVSAPGHAGVVLANVQTGTSGLKVQLGPEIIVHGEVKGDLSQLQHVNHEPVLTLETTEKYDNASNGRNEWVPLHVAADGTATFVFTNRTALPSSLSGAGYHEERTITAPVADWVVDLTQVKPQQEAKDLPKREVIFRFKDPSGGTPHGTVAVEIPDNLDISHLTAHEQTMAITNGEVRTQIAIGGRTSLWPKQMVGYWFDRGGPNGAWYSILMTNGPGPMVIEVPLIPAGAIYAHAKNADGTPAGGLMFGVSELKRARGRTDNSQLGDGSDGFSSDAPRQWVSGALPLGGTYQVYAWRGNLFTVGKAVKLTESNPDAEVELQFPAGQNFNGVVLDASGQPLRDAELKPLFKLPDDHAFGLKSVYTDGQGRFVMTDMSPDAGKYTVEVDARGQMAEAVKLDFGAQPQTIRLKSGHTLAGRVVDAAARQPLPEVEVRVWTTSGNLPAQTTQTDQDGRFAFTTLGNAEYSIYVNDGQVLDNAKHYADGSTNLIFPVKLYAWSNVHPKAVDTNGINSTQPHFQTRLQAIISKGSTGSMSADFAPGDNNGYGHSVAKQSAAGVNTNGPSVLISATFYMARPEDIKSVTSGMTFQPGDNGNGSWANVPAGSVGNMRGQLKNAFQPMAAPRALSFSGQPVQMTITDGTNRIGIDCTPWVTNGQVRLDMSKDVQTGGGGTQQFLGTLLLENHGSALLSLNNLEGSPSNIVALVQADIITNRGSQFVQRLQNIIQRAPGTNAAAPMYSPQHQKIFNQLQSTRLAQFMPFEEETLQNVVMRLSKAIRQQGTNSDGVNFVVLGPDTNQPARLDPSTGLPSEQSGSVVDARTALVHLNAPMENLTVMDILDRMVMTSVPPVKYTIADYGVVFSAKLPGEGVSLFTRLYRLDTNALLAKFDLRDSTSDFSQSTNSPSAIYSALRHAFSNEGVNLDAPPGKAMFYKDRSGILFVRTTEADLDKIGQLMKRLGILSTGPATQGLPQQSLATRLTSAVNPLGPTKTQADASRTEAEVQRASSQPGLAQSQSDSAQTMTFKLEAMLQRDQFKDQLAAEGVVAPTAYQYFDNGMLVVRGTAEQLALVNRAVLRMNGVTNAADTTKFVERARASVTATGDETNLLFTRTYKVEQRRLQYELEKSGQTTSASLSGAEIAEAMRQMFTRFGVDMDAPAGKSVFFNDGSGILFVKATAADLNSIDAIIQAMNQAPPQVHLKVRYIELPKAGFKDPAFAGRTNASVVGILSGTNARAMLQMLQQIKGAHILGEPEVTSLSGREVRMMQGDNITIITNMNYSESLVSTVKTNLHMHKPPTFTTNVTTVGAISPGLDKLDFGLTFDATPKVMVDGITVKLPLTASHTEFWGYAQVPKHYPLLVVTNFAGEVLNPPRIWPVASDSRVTTDLVLRDGETEVLELPEPALTRFDEPEATKDETVMKHYQAARSKKGDTETLVFVTADLVDAAGNLANPRR